MIIALLSKALLRISSLSFLRISHFCGLRPMSSDSTHRRLFQLKLDPLTGNSEWVVIEEHGDEPEEAFRSSQGTLLSTTSYLDMLNDSPRNRAFRQAIDMSITRPCHVLDIGAGTGLLSMMSAQAMRGGGGVSEAAGNTKGMVTACESYLPMVKLMRKVLHLNGMGRNVKVVNKRSDELDVGVDIASRADVMVSEILDSELLGEGLIPTLQHAHDDLLVDNPITVPYRATTYGQLVEGTFFWKLHDLYNNKAKASDDIHLVPSGMDTILRIKPQQYPMHCDVLSKEIKLLSEPFKIFEFDFWRRPDSYGEAKLVIKATSDGTIHAIVSWWTLQLDHEGTIFYSTAPKWINLPMNISSGNWCDHWKQCVWFVPGIGIPVSKGDDVMFHAVHTKTSILYDVATQATTKVRQDDNLNSLDFHLILSPERIAIYGDIKWRSSMLTALRNAVRSISLSQVSFSAFFALLHPCSALQLQGRVNPLCVVADDSVFLTLLVSHLSKTSHVISLFPGLRDRGGEYLQKVSNANGLTADHINVFLEKKCLTLEHTNQKTVDLLIGEPFYYGNDGALPWQNLRFWKERTLLDSILSKDVLIMPCKAILKACAMSLPDLWNSRRSLSKIEGFDHSIINTTLGACGELPAGQEGPLLPYFIWQCGEIKELSEMFTIMELDFAKPICSCSGKVQVEFTETGICHGFALWMDWVMDAKNSVVVSTGPDQRYWKQGVKLLSQPVEVGIHGSSTDEDCRATVEASFDPSRGELVVQHSFSSHFCSHR